MLTYRVHDTAGDDHGTLEHPAPNLKPGDAVVLEDGREALVARESRRTVTDRWLRSSRSPSPRRR